MNTENSNLAVIEADVDQPMTAADIKSQVVRIQEIMRAVMVEGVHWGTIPGIDKPILLLPGAQKLGVTFRLAPEFAIERIDLGNGHREYQVNCTLTHIPTGRMLGQGVGSCSTLETKYRYRQGERKCPQCGRATIIKGRAEYGGGWLCFQKKGGCGAKFGEHDTSITSQAVGRVENPDIADLWNVAVKMAKKRAYVDATLTVTAASDIFTQDLLETESDPEPLTATLPVQSPPAPAPLKVEPKADPESDAVITQGQRKRLFALLREAGIGDLDFKDFLKQTYNLESTAKLQQSQYELVCENITDGSVSSFLLGEEHPE